MATVTGEQKTWHKITIDFAAPQTFSETPSTFRDYRLDVTFVNTNSGEEIIVPGYFAADGNAANSNATSGNIWRVNFNPPSEGNWEYEASFRTGTDIAAKPYEDAPFAGKAVNFINGESGSFKVTPTDKTGDDFRAKGMILQDEGTHYLQHQGDQDYFIRGGPGIPENFLANQAFDNTANGRHDYGTHFDDFNAGDPTWDGGKGKAIIGATNYLAEQGLNTIYIMTNTSGGDGRDVSPWTFAAQNTPVFDNGISDSEKAKFSTYDVSKLSQWEILFDHMDEKGIYKNILFQEQENDQQLNNGTDAAGTSLSVERMVYLREMIARFGHNNGVQWNLGEENTNTDAERADMAEYVKSVDGYDHLVVIHSFPSQIDQVYNPLLDDEAFDGSSFQTGAVNIRNRIIEFRDKSADAGDPWVLAWDEDSSGNGVIDLYTNNPDSKNEKTLREAFWGTLTAGGSGGNWYFKGSSGHSLDQNYDTFEAHTSVWKWTAAATSFFNTYVPFWDMKQADWLTSDNDDFVMAQQGQYYVIYLPYGEAGNVNLNLSGYGGETFDVFWYNPRQGGDLIPDGQITGGGFRQIGGPPSTVLKDWVLLVRNTDAPEFPQASAGGTNPPPPPPVDENTKPIAVDDSAETGQNQTILVDVLANDRDPDGDSLRLLNVTYNGSTSGVSIENGKVKVNPFGSATNERVETITYTVGDGNGGTDTGVLKVEVAGGTTPPPPPEPEPEPEPEPPAPPANQAPTAVDDRAETDHNQTILVDVLANDSDPDGDTLKLLKVWYNGSTSGVSIENGKIKVNPFSSATNDRVEKITYAIGDGNDATHSAVLLVDVNGTDAPVPPPEPPTPPVNTAPTAVDDSAKTAQNKTIFVDVLANDSDPDGDSLSLVGVSYNGSTSGVSIENGKVKVNPFAFTTKDRVETITYTVADGKGGTDSATLEVAVGNPDVSPPPDPGPGVPSVLDFFIADAATNETVRSLEDGDQIDLDTLSDAITFYALADGFDIDYATLTFQGTTSTERVEPYALFGDVDGDFNKGLDLSEGTYVLEAAAYDSDGNLVEAIDLGFELI